MQRVRIVDSHTAGEPTRLVLDGGPDLGDGSVADRLAVFRVRHDRWRSAIVNEPRGSDALVGALLCPPHDRSCRFGLIFFNNVGTIGMCGHGTIGTVASLAHLGEVEPGEVRIETPVGVVTAELHPSGEVTVANVPSFRYRKDVAITVAGVGPVRGDIAWGGNWFFLVERSDLQIRPSNLPALIDFAVRVRRALASEGVTAKEGAEIDHIELTAPAESTEADSRNFVLCPGHAYDRSPCGTGTSAKLACLVEDGKLREGQQWRQQGILGSVFHGSVRIRDGRVHPLIRGSAYVTLEGTLLIDEERDPFGWGIR